MSKEDEEILEIIKSTFSIRNVLLNLCNKEHEVFPDRYIKLKEWLLNKKAIIIKSRQDFSTHIEETKSRLRWLLFCIVGDKVPEKNTFEYAFKMYIEDAIYVIERLQEK